MNEKADAVFSSMSGNPRCVKCKKFVARTFEVHFAANIVFQKRTQEIIAVTDVCGDYCAWQKLADDHEMTLVRCRLRYRWRRRYATPTPGAEFQYKVVSGGGGGGGSVTISHTIVGAGNYSVVGDDETAVLLNAWDTI